MTDKRVMTGKFCIVFLAAASFVLTSPASADKKGKSKHGHHDNRGHTQLSISPYGLGFSYENKNFGIGLGRGALGFAPAGPLFPIAPPVVPYAAAETYAYPVPAGPVLVEPLPPFDGYAPATPFDSSMPAAGGPLPNGSAAPQGNRFPPTISTNPSAAKFKTRAEKEFREQNYQDARRYIDFALLQDNTNGHLLLFASHISMALADYERATIELDAATQRLHRSQWDFFSRNSLYWYPENGYEQQLQVLDEFCENQKQDHGFALRGFQRACTGQIKSARKDFYHALAINPDNQLVLRLQSQLQNPPAGVNSYPPAQTRPSPNAFPADPRMNAPVSGASVEVPPPPRHISPMRSVLERRTK